MKYSFRFPERTPLRRRAGFTLVELIIAMSISVTVCAMAVYFLFEGLRSSLKTSSIYTNDMTQWGLTNRLLIDTKLANNIEVFTDNTASTLTAAVTAQGGIAEGSFGNFIVLALGSMVEVSTTQQQYQYTSLYGYYFNPNAQTLSRFQYTIPSNETLYASPPSAPTPIPSVGLEALVSEHLAQFQYTVVGTNLSLQPWPAGAPGTNGAFLNRRNGQLANMLVRASAGPTNGNNVIAANTFTRSDRMIEVSFYARQ
jgi:prepilin-type N-terminal cleavage/methylation domain-containing protein